MAVSRARRQDIAFRELDLVWTRASIGIGGEILPSRSLGTIVLAHRDGLAFEVEFTAPFEALVTLEADEIEPAEWPN